MFIDKVRRSGYSHNLSFSDKNAIIEVSDTQSASFYLLKINTTFG